MQGSKIGDIADGNRSRDVHVVRLIDHDSSTIWLNEQPLMPFSARNTCGECHDYDRIASGWHFNAGYDPENDGRPGQPWIFSDPLSLTQLPLSYRNWPGAFNPDSIGLKPFDFVSIFGRHAPGGGIGDDDRCWNKENIVRWWISGPSEVNCLGCHDASPAYDHAEYASQMMKQNFRWASTAASDIAMVNGAARDMPDNYDIYRGTAPDEAQKKAPTVFYDPIRFNPQNKVFFDITTRIPDENCYFCHSQVIADSLAAPEEDVHLKAGLRCVDCHTNGLDHMIDRGNDSSENSCRNCHFQTGRYGAPKPTHDGLPPLHLVKLSCTTCHAGPKPRQNTRSVKTSMAHALGVHGINKSPGVLPHIAAPVYMTDESGVIFPNYLLWPSFWGKLSGDSLLPLNPLDIRQVVNDVIRFDDSLSTGSWPPVTDSLIYRVLDTLCLSGITGNEPVYVSRGGILKRGANRKLEAISSGSAGPYIWPLAHDVRPAAQSLGSDGCTECHDNNSPFFFGQIGPDGPLPLHEQVPVIMSDLQKKSSLQRRVFAASFLFRPWLKGLLIGATAFSMLVLFIYMLRGMNAIIHFLQREES